MNFRRIYPHLISILIFIVVSILYFHPVLNGKKMLQSDITQHIGMAKEVNDFRNTTGEEPYWAESAFSGMPTYQIGTYFPNDYIYYIDNFFRFLPRPADYLFLYFLGFYVLLMVFKVHWRSAIVGSLAFGFSTYLIIIFAAGHNAKAHAIGYIPFVMAGIISVFQKNYLLGFVITALSMSLEIKANHPQMTYYLLFGVLLFCVVEFIEALKEKKITQFFTQIGTIAMAMILALGVNSTRLLATKEYADVSTRGASELSINSDGTKKEKTDGLSRDYITQFSYGIPETFNLLVPRYMGGGTIEKLGKDSNTYQFVTSIAGKKQADAFTKQVLTYWGDQPIVEAPAYVGAVMIFLFFLGIFTIRGKIKYWLVATTVFAILLSWGRNFQFLTNFFIDYVPLYNKFRAVSSIQVIAEFCIPLLGILALHKFLSTEITNQEKQQSLRKALFITVGLVVLGLCYAVTFSTFEGLRDLNYAQYEGLLDAVKADRKSMLYSDSFRSILFIVICFGILKLFLMKKMNQSTVNIALAILVLFDLGQVDLRYVNQDDFKSAREIDKPFIASNADIQIKKDKSHYRVANFTTDPFQDGSTSYFHKSIGGYHAAKIGRYQDLIEFHLAKKNIEVFNMLNVKYFIVSGENDAVKVQQNFDNNGNAWFVNEIKYVTSVDEEIKALDSIPTKFIAVVNENDVKNKWEFNRESDSKSSIKLLKYNLNSIQYESFSTVNQFAVFSEIYYENGWNAYVDGELKPHYQVNYVLRGMEIPAGKHTIEFKFEPKIIQIGGIISLISYALLFFIPISFFIYQS